MRWGFTLQAPLAGGRPVCHIPAEVRPVPTFLHFPDGAVSPEMADHPPAMGGLPRLLLPFLWDEYLKRSDTPRDKPPTAQEALFVLYPAQLTRQTLYCVRRPREVLGQWGGAGLHPLGHLPEHLVLHLVTDPVVPDFRRNLWIRGPSASHRPDGWWHLVVLPVGAAALSARQAGEPVGVAVQPPGPVLDGIIVGV